MKRFAAVPIVLLLLIVVNVFAADLIHNNIVPSSEPAMVGYSPHKIVVKFNPTALPLLKKNDFERGRTGLPDLDQLGERIGVEKIQEMYPGVQKRFYKGKTIDLEGWHRIKFFDPIDPLEAVKKYKQLPWVIDAQPVSIHRVHKVPYEQFYNYQWHLPKIQAPHAWDVETGNSSIVVAVLDTGVRYFAKDLGGANASYYNPTNVNGNVWVNWAEKNGIPGADDDGNGFVDDWIGWDFVDDSKTFGIPNYPCYPGEDCGTPDNDPRDFNGHGTHCAGNIAAINNNGEAVASPSGGWGNGTLQPTANGVKVMTLRIGWSAAWFGFFEVGLVEMDFAAEALRYAADNGARIVSCSWGSGNTGGIDDAINYFLASGGLIFVAAGNANNETADYIPGLNNPLVTSVAATDQNDCKASFSSYGTWVDISAPGQNIYSLFHMNSDPVTDYVDTMDGTSMATPLAASVAALIWSRNPDLTATQVRAILLNSADPIDNLYCNGSYTGKLGTGRINAYRAVTSVAPPQPQPPVAEFSANPTAGYAPLTVQFTDLSMDAPTNWLWDFGDAQTSALQNPSHIYNRVGTYTVSLTATNAAGSDIVTKTGYIHVDANTPAKINVLSLATGKYVTVKIGRTRTTQFTETSSFAQGDEIIFRATVASDDTFLVGATVYIQITGPGNFSLPLTSNPSNSIGVAEAKWKTAAPTKKNSGTPIGSFTATVTSVSAAGYAWDGVPRSASFSINAK